MPYELLKFGRIALGFVVTILVLLMVNSRQDDTTIPYALATLVSIGATLALDKLYQKSRVDRDFD